jgi:hypothetical protein
MASQLASHRDLEESDGELSEDKEWNEHAQQVGRQVEMQHADYLHFRHLRELQDEIESKAQDNLTTEKQKCDELIRRHLNKREIDKKLDIELDQVNVLEERKRAARERQWIELESKALAYNRSNERDCKKKRARLIPILHKAKRDGNSELVQTITRKINKYNKVAVEIAADRVNVLTHEFLPPSKSERKVRDALAQLQFRGQLGHFHEPHLVYDPTPDRNPDLISVGVSASIARETVVLGMYDIDEIDERVEDNHDFSCASFPGLRVLRLGLRDAGSPAQKSLLKYAQIKLEKDKEEKSKASDSKEKKDESRVSGWSSLPTVPLDEPSVHLSIADRTGASNRSNASSRVTAPAPTSGGVERRQRLGSVVPSTVRSGAGDTDTSRTANAQPGSTNLNIALNGKERRKLPPQFKPTSGGQFQQKSLGLARSASAVELRAHLDAGGKSESANSKSPPRMARSRSVGVRCPDFCRRISTGYYLSYLFIDLFLDSLFVIFF